MTILKDGGRAAIVLPDNVLFDAHAGKQIRKLLLTDCQLHTILRLPIGTFTPYSPGVQANILFFRKGMATEEVWIYDLRTNVEKITKAHPLSDDYFKDFEICYNSIPRKETYRFRRFTLQEIQNKDYDLDILWPKGGDSTNSDVSQEPSELVAEAIAHLESALASLNEMALKIDSNDLENYEPPTS